MLILRFIAEVLIFYVVVVLLIVFILPVPPAVDNMELVLFICCELDKELFWDLLSFGETGFGAELGFDSYDCFFYFFIIYYSFYITTFCLFSCYFFNIYPLKSNSSRIIDACLTPNLLKEVVIFSA